MLGDAEGPLSFLRQFPADFRIDRIEGKKGALEGSRPMPGDKEVSAEMLECETVEVCCLKDPVYVG